MPSHHRMTATVRPAIVSMLVALMLGAATVAWAQPPDNDDFANATIVAALPFADSQDTTEATTEAGDPDCVGNGPTVWYAFTPSSDIRLEANTFGSDYDTTVSAWTGSQGALAEVACNDDAAGGVQSRIRFDALGGTTYYFMVGAFASGPGGNLSFTLDEAPPLGPPPELGLTIAPTGSVRHGSVTIRGTITCNTPVSGFLDLFVRQRAGRAFVNGFGGTGYECTDSTPWEVTVVGDNGFFAGGRVEVQAFSFACDADEQCDDAEASRTVRITGSPR